MNTEICDLCASGKHEECVEYTECPCPCNEFLRELDAQEAS